MQKVLSTTNFIAGSPGSGLQNSFFIPNPAKTLGITCLPIMKINPGINHQVNTDLICGHKTYGFNTSSENIVQSSHSIEWKVPINELNKAIEGTF
jgi:capsular polysaccharide biosynthesis protein